MTALKRIHIDGILINTILINMINKNKLTLKSLQKQLDDIKAYKEQNINTKVKKVEEIDSKSTVTHMKSFPLFFMYGISWFILLANKIPIIRKLIPLLKAYYGKTSIWKLIIIFRKIFIVFNAIIGVYSVFKFTGIGSESILANFVGMGYSYIDILINFAKRLFNWFLDLFDYKIVPNVSNNNNNSSW